MITASVPFLSSVRFARLVLILLAVSGLSDKANADCPNLLTLSELSGIAKAEAESHGRPIIFTAALFREGMSGLVSTANIRKSNVDSWVVWHAKTDNLDELRTLIYSNRKIVAGQFSGLGTSGIIVNLQLARPEAVAQEFSTLCKTKIEFDTDRKISLFQSQPSSRTDICESLSMIAAALGLRLEKRAGSLVVRTASERRTISESSGDRTKTCDDFNCIVTSYGKLELHRQPSNAAAPVGQYDVTKITLNGAVIKMLDSHALIEAAHGCANHADIVLLKEDRGEGGCNEYRVLELKSSTELVVTEKFGSCASVIDVATAPRYGLREGRVFESGEWRLAFSPHSSRDDKKWKPDWFIYRNGKITAPTVSRAAFVDGLKARHADDICYEHKTRRYGGTREHCAEQLPRLLDQCELSMASLIPGKFLLQSDVTSNYRQKLVECVQLSYQKLHWNSPAGRKIREIDKKSLDICLSAGRNREECEDLWGKHPYEKQI